MIRRILLRWKRWILRWKYVLLALFFILSTWYYFCIPGKLFDDPTCTVIYDRNGEMLSARIASDGQWRFPYNPHVPEKFRKAIIRFEDRNFYSHWGISIRAFGRALSQNLSAGKVVSGGSTITMQTIRLMRKGKNRTFYEKIIEAILATRIEWSYTKDEILSLYASHAPMGGNVVGLDAAAWRYFGRSPDHLSWAETATLAVLPNAPSLIFPGKNQSKLLAKRNRLLENLFQNGDIDKDELELAMSEPLPGTPPDLPQLTPHLTNRIISDGYAGKSIITTIDRHLQEKVVQILQRHSERLKDDEIYNAACIVIDVNSGGVLAYAGNIKNEDPEHGGDVDVINAPRSTGSILKPLLYAAMLNDGNITPSMLYPDIPTHISGYTPKNYNHQYDGAVPAGRALSRSLNVPSVRMLQQYGIPRFHHFLKKLGMTTLHRPSSHYGLSLVLGGAEAKLWDLAAIYATMARTLNQYPDFKNDINKTPSYILKNYNDNSHSIPTPVLDPAAIWFTFKAMLEVARPDEESNWQHFSSSSKIAWKTGTSFGFRDAWAVGVNPGYVVAVWAGNADGEGRPGLVGIQAAAPILFDVFSRLPKKGWFVQPYDEMTKMRVCRLSGYKATDICTTVDTIFLPNACINTEGCPFHQLIHLDKEKKFRVDSDCENPVEMEHVSWFVLPPVMEYYYKMKNPTYQPLPEYRSDCISLVEERSMEIIYPKKSSRIFVPVELNGEKGKTVLEAKHRNKSITIYWHLDEKFLGTTTEIHQVEVNPSSGRHRLTLIDENGATVSQEFEVYH